VPANFARTRCHLLEADHKNLITPTSLEGLLGQCPPRSTFFHGKHVLRTREEVAFHVHLFAIADEQVRRAWKRFSRQSRFTTNDN
jgi:hypothetical protein